MVWAHGEDASGLGQLEGLSREIPGIAETRVGGRIGGV